MKLSRLQPRTPTGVKLFGLVGSALVGIYFLVPRGTNGAHLAYEVVVCVGLLAIGGGLLRNQPKDGAWLLIFVGLALWAAGDTVWNVYRWALGHEAPFPSVADVFYLVCYLPLIAGVVALVRGGRPKLADLTDAGIAGLGAVLVIWFAVVEPVAKAHSADVLARIVATAYPVCDTFLLLALIQLVVARGLRTAALRYLAAAFALILVTDVVYARARIDASFSPGSWLDAGYLLFYVLLGCAFLSPSVNDVHAPLEVPSRRVSRLRLAGLSAPLLVAPTFIATGHAANAMGARVLGIGAAVMGLLVFARLLVVFRERESIDQARLSAQAQLAEMAYRDPLTGIANRYALYDAVDAGVEAAAGGESGLAILFVDLDGFKSVNDRFGHAEGDEVLRAVAARLRKAVRDHDVVARHGGDEFVVMMSGLPSAEARELAELLAGRLTAALAPPFDVNGSECIVGVTIGLSVYPADGTSADELIDAADRSMYRGKGIVAEDRRGITLAS